MYKRQVGEDDEDVVKNTLARLDGKRPVLASNAVGGESALRLMDMLAPGGRMVTYGAMSRKSIKVPNGVLMFKGIKVEGLWVTQWLKKMCIRDRCLRCAPIPGTGWMRRRRRRPAWSLLPAPSAGRR